MNQQPDIIFIVLDTQRADRLSCYGHTTKTSPNLDKFAEQAVLFQQAIAPAQWTIPTHASMFTGLYPTAHQVTQSHQSLGADAPHLAEILQTADYDTVGFCNNPLVGILNNGFKRGFQQFYNYGGAFPDLPPNEKAGFFGRLKDKLNQMMQRITQPIQNLFGQSDLALSIAIYSWLTPIWSRWANFKGQNERSVKDVVNFLQNREEKKQEKPLFLFLNLMETHLPFYPPQKYVDQVAPYMRNDKEAREIMRRWNHEAYRWAAPLPSGLSEKERRVLSDMYDAEVAYQDDYLQKLFTVLEQRKNKENTLTIIVGDHGDGLGEHQYFGHAFVAYQELVHVPLIMHWPKQLSSGQKVAQTVSTRRVYHTVLDALAELPELPQVNPAEVRGLSLCEVAHGRDVEESTAFTEIYPPLNFVRAIEHRQPELIDSFRCLDLRRAIVKDDLKLILLDDEPDELFNLDQDKLELENIIRQRPADKAVLTQQATRIINTVETQRDSLQAGTPLDLEHDEELVKRLRGLGYID